jgi:protein KRI1
VPPPRQALEHGPELASDDEDDNARAGDDRAPKAYDEEQENLRRAFISAAEEVGPCRVQ